MISAPTSCFYLMKVEGEAVHSVAAELSPSTAADIEVAIFTSADFENDIVAVNSLATGFNHVKSISLLGDTLQVDERYNPLYVPSPIEKIDEMLILDPRADGVRFVGFSGNPFTLKAMEAKAGDETLISAKVDYRPFDMPAYSDIVAETQGQVLN